MQAKPTKKARSVGKSFSRRQSHKRTNDPFQGPAHGRPMPLFLPSGSEVESGEFTSNNGKVAVAIQQHKTERVMKGKRVELERSELFAYQRYLCMLSHINLRKFSASSFYPGRGDYTHALAHLDHGNHTFHAPAVDDDGVETDEDSVDDDQAVELALKYPNKFSENVANEVSRQHSSSHLN
jgi:hypothetical protein